MKILLFFSILSLVGFVGGAIMYCCAERLSHYTCLSPCAFCTGALLAFMFALLCAMIPVNMAEGKLPNEVNKELACSNQRIVAKTKIVPSLLNINPEHRTNKYECYSVLEQETAYEVTKVESTSDGDITCYIKEENGVVNPISVLKENVRLSSDRDGKEDTPRVVKTEVYKTIVLVEKPTFIENALHSIVYEDYEVGDILYIEQNPSETTYTIYLSEQDFQNTVEQGE